MGKKIKETSKWFELGNFLDHILIVNSCYEDDKTIITTKCHTLFLDGVLPWKCNAALASASEGWVQVFQVKKTQHLGFLLKKKQGKLYQHQLLVFHGDVDNFSIWCY